MSASVPAAREWARDRAQERNGMNRSAIQSRVGVTVILPTYNEEGAIGQTLAKLKETLPSLRRPTEIVVVDDGSSDRSAEVATAAGVRVIRHPRNCGYGHSLLTGILAANYNSIVITDADGTYPIDKLPDLLAMYDRGFDMVVGARTGQHYIRSLRQKLLRLTFRLLAEFTCGRKIPDINSGFRVFDRRPVLMWRRSLSTGFSFTTTITLLFMLNTLIVGYLPIPYEKRVGSSKVRLFHDSLRSLQIMLTTIAQFNPIKLYLLLLVFNLLGNAILGSFMFWTSVALSWFYIAVMVWNAWTLVFALAILALGQLKPDPNEVFPDLTD